VPVDVLLLKGAIFKAAQRRADVRRDERQDRLIWVRDVTRILVSPRHAHGHTKPPSQAQLAAFPDLVTAARRP
jgi:hypothetical protein